LSRLSVKAKLVSALSVILLVAFVATSVVNYRVSRDAVREELLTTGLPLTRDTIHSELRAELMRPLFVSSLMGTDTFLRDWALDGERDTQSVRKYLEEIRNRYGSSRPFSSPRARAATTTTAGGSRPFRAWTCTTCGTTSSWAAGASSPWTWTPTRPRAAP
jgi:hypothetical protein